MVGGGPCPVQGEVVSAFDAAIKVLHEALKTAVIDIPCPICQIESAIRVLTAAGKVDKPLCLSELNFLSEAGEDGEPEDVLAFMQLRALLSALPGPEKETKQ